MGSPRATRPHEAGDAARAWADASARALCRRLRRQHREELGEGRAAALHRRMQLIQAGLVREWEIGELVGTHPATLRESIKAAVLVKVTQARREDDELFVQCNWAKHAPPPAQRPARPVPAGMDTIDLEDFRETLYAAHVSEQGGEKERDSEYLDRTLLELDARMGRGGTIEPFDQTPELEERAALDWESAEDAGSLARREPKDQETAAHSHFGSEAVTNDAAGESMGSAQVTTADGGDTDDGDHLDEPPCGTVSRKLANGPEADVATGDSGGSALRTACETACRKIATGSEDGAVSSDEVLESRAAEAPCRALEPEMHQASDPLHRIPGEVLADLKRRAWEAALGEFRSGVRDPDELVTAVLAELDNDINTEDGIGAWGDWARAQLRAFTLQ